MYQKYPLLWPVGYPRTDRPKRSAFKNPTLGKTVQNIIAEVNRLLGYWATDQNDQVVISSNVPLRNDGMPRADYLRSIVGDKGVAVYFKRNGKEVVLCCDQWDTVESNLHAIYKSIEAMRAIERWGVSDFIERSFTGFTALPEYVPHFWEILGFEFMPAQIPKMWELCVSLYREKAKKHHPDNGGSISDFQRIQRAYEEAKRYFGK